MWWSATDFCHRSWPDVVQQIAERGFGVTLGAGSGTSQAHHGCLAPGVFVAGDLSTTISYPMTPTGLPFQAGKEGLNGGN